jgi:curved DNA-binding protein CbpA
MSVLDYYAILGIPPDALQADIVRAYRRRARQCHPDMVSEERRTWAEAEMKRLNMAYGVLSNPNKRASYDRQRLWEEDPVLRRVQTERVAYVQRQAAQQSWKRIRRGVTLTLDVISIFYFVLVGFLILFVWRDYYSTIMRAIEHPNELLMLFIWFFVAMRLLLRSIPFPRLRRPIRWF